jgi:hypothetical protein
MQVGYFSKEGSSKELKEWVREKSPTSNLEQEFLILLI